MSEIVNDEAPESAASESMDAEEIRPSDFGTRRLTELYVIAKKTGQMVTEEERLGTRVFPCLSKPGPLAEEWAKETFNFLDP